MVSIADFLIFQVCHATLRGKLSGQLEASVLRRFCAWYATFYIGGEIGLMPQCKILSSEFDLFNSKQRMTLHTPGVKIIDLFQMVTSISGYTCDYTDQVLRCSSSASWA